VITGGGVAVRKDKQRQLGTATQNNVTSTEHGLGDVLLKGQYVLLSEKAVLPEIAPYLKIKFPTADSDRGLGTATIAPCLRHDGLRRLEPATRRPLPGRCGPSVRCPVSAALSASPQPRSECSEVVRWSGLPRDVYRPEISTK